METFVGDIVTIVLETLIDLTGYTRYIKYRKPDGTKGTWPASMHPSYNTMAYYTTAVGDLDQAGVWKVQVYVTSLTFNSHGKVCDLVVKDVLAATLSPTTATLTTSAPTTATP